MNSAIESSRQVLRAHGPGVLVALIFLALATWNNLVVPIGEADNEVSHYRYIQYIKAEKQLPPASYVWPTNATADQCQDSAAVDAQDPEHQFRQPPLYYLLASGALFWLDTTDNWWPPVNYYSVHSSHTDGGYNVAIHTAAENFPYRGTALAVHVIRGFSTLLGLLGLVAVYLTGQLIFRDKTGAALLAAAVGFVPTYVFSAATISNDILVGALGCACVYFCLRSVLDDIRLSAFWVAMLCMTLAFLTKYNGVVLAPMVAITAVALIVRSRRISMARLRSSLTTMGLAVTMLSLLPLWWLLRNKQLYGTYFVNYPNMAQPFTTKVTWLGELSLSRLAADARFSFETLWGLLGADVIRLPSWMTLVLTAACALIAVGLFIQLRARDNPRRLKALVLLAVILIVANWWFLYLLINLKPPRGRYLLPLFSMLGFLLIWGSRALRTPRFPWLGSYLFCGMLLLCSILVPPLVLGPVYAQPTLATDQALRAGEQPVYAMLDDFAELLAIQIEPQSVAPYEALDVTLVWRSVKPTPDNYVVGVHLIGADETYYGGTSHLPDKGNYATSLWQPGTVFRDSYRFYMQGAAPGKLPTAGLVKVSLYCPQSAQDSEVMVRDQAGNVLGDAVYSGPLRLGLPVTAAQAPQDAVARFGNEIELVRVDGLPDALPAPGQAPQIKMQMVWHALQRPAADYTLYLHLLDAQGNYVTGTDRPLTNDYYPSGLWLPGETITDVHTLDLSAVAPLRSGTYELTAGLYPSATQERLPLQAAADATVADGYLLGRWPVSTHFMYAPAVWHTGSLPR